MIGIIAAFGASLSWTFACFIWREHTNSFRPLDINHLKNIIAFLFFLPVLIGLNFQIEAYYIILLLISGIIGIGIGDTLYLKSLKLIGTRKTLSIEALSPLIAGLSGNFFINEELNRHSLIGFVMISISLIKIISKRDDPTNREEQARELISRLNQFSYAFLSILCAVFAAVLSRIVLINSSLSPIETTEIRLLGAILFLSLLTRQKLINCLKEMDKKKKLTFILSIIFGTNFGILFQQLVFKTLPIGIGWTLLSTSPLFSLLFSKGEEGFLTKETIFFTFTLFIGISLIFL